MKTGGKIIIFSLLILIIGIFILNKIPYPSIRIVEKFNRELLKKTDISLDDAVKIAVNNTGGTVIDAKIKFESGYKQPIYKIGLLKNNEFISVRIDGHTGKILNIGNPPTPPESPVFYKTTNNLRGAK